MIRTFLLGLVLATIPLASIHAGEDDGHDHAPPAPSGPVVAEPGEVAVVVKGLVCTFCAVGIEKRLKDVEAIDRSRLNKGLLADIDHQLVRVALRPGAAVPFREIARGVKRAGYEAVRFHLRVEGESVQAADGANFVATAPPGRFALAGAPAEPAGGFQLRVEATDVAGLEGEGPWPAHVDDAH